MLFGGRQEGSFMQLNPFEIKAEILGIISDCANEENPLVLNERVKRLDSLDDTTHIEKILFKELLNAKASKEKIIRFLLQRYVPKERLISELWNVLKNNMTSSEVKIIVLSYLRELETDWKYEDFESALGEDIDIIDNDTKTLLNAAIVNPEVQIDFLDFLNSVEPRDKLLLVKSLGEDYSQDALANILIPVFLSEPESEVGKEALGLLGNSRSQLAYHALNTAYDFVSDELRPLVKKNLNLLKLSGIREDNSVEFYKNLLSNSHPYRCCITYPDGHGNQALIFSRTNKEKKVQFVAVVMNDYSGIRDCFGFNEISEFECDKIIERFYKDEKNIPISPSVLKTFLNFGERISKNHGKNWLLPYEYICWKNLLSDIPSEVNSFENLLSEKFKKRTLTFKDLELVFDADFLEHWFLDSKYSSEFEAFLETLDSKILENSTDLDCEVSSNLLKIFYPEEYGIWRHRLLTCAYLKFCDKKTDIADVLYNLFYDSELYIEFLKHILKKSIYEYYFSLKFNTDDNQNKFTLKQLDDIISSIENKWVKNA